MSSVMDVNFVIFNADIMYFIYTSYRWWYWRPM